MPKKPAKKKSTKKPKAAASLATVSPLLADVRTMILRARGRAARAVLAELTMLYSTQGVFLIHLHHRLADERFQSSFAGRIKRLELRVKFYSDSIHWENTIEGIERL